MSRLVDNLVAYRILSMMIKPFTDTAAYQLGIIDEKGNNLKKSSTLTTSKEKDAYTYLHRLVFNMKKIINRLPGGDSKLKNLVTAFFLVKEYYESGDRSLSLMEDRYERLLEKVNKYNLSLVEEEILIVEFLERGVLLEDGVANVTGGEVSTDAPAPKAKDIKKYKQLARRKLPVQGS
jgi:hypothetical protein